MLRALLCEHSHTSCPTPLPCDQVAFLDEADSEQYGPTQYSVCMRGRDITDVHQLPHLDDQAIYELYRIRLPYNKFSSR